MATTPKPALVWDGTEWVPIGNPVLGEDLGVTDHPALTGRTSEDSHPISAITDLDTELASKSDLDHSHPGLNIAPGVGIDLSDGDPNVITNIDTGSDAVSAHVGAADPHSGTYSPQSHEHSEYAEESHDHGAEYDTAGTAASLDAEHVAAQDPHPNYLAPYDAIAGDGIGVVENPDGSITIENLAMNGQPLIAAALVGNGSGQTIPNNAFTELTAVVEDGDAGGLIDPTKPNGFTITQRGVYLVTASIGFIANATGQRAIRINVNGAQPSGGTARCPATASDVSNQVWVGQLVLNQGDVVTFLGYQDTGSDLATQSGSTRFTISKVNGATQGSVVGVAATQTAEYNVTDSTWRGMATETVVLNTIGAEVGTTMGTAGITMTEASPEGWYDLVVSGGFAANASGNRRLQILLNGLVSNAPLIPKSNVYPPGAGIQSTMQVAGPIYLKPGDLLRPEIYQNSGSGLLTAPQNCSISLLFRGVDINQETEGDGLTASPLPAQGGWRPYAIGGEIV